MRQGSRKVAVVAILLTNCLVALQYGLIFPVLPQLVELRASGSDSAVLHTGLIAAIYPLALFLFAPLWGRWSDTHNPVQALIVALVAFSATFALWFLPQSLALLYVNRFLSGAFVAAVFPISQVMVAELAPDLRKRAQMFSWLSIALNFGYLAGPAVGGWFGESLNGAEALRATAVMIAILAVLCAILLAWYSPKEFWVASRATTSSQAAVTDRAAVITKWSLLTLSALTAVAISTFEVGMSVKGRTEMHLSAGHLGGLMAECMLVMIVAQAIVFNTTFPAHQSWRLLTPCFVILVFALPIFAESRTPIVLVVGTAVMAATTGVMFPVISYWMSMIPSGRGLTFGRQTAATNLGQVFGSASVGMFSDASSGAVTNSLPAIVGALGGILISLFLHSSLSALSKSAFGSERANT